MARYTFRVGATRARLPISDDDVVWFGQQLQRRAVERSKITASAIAARDLGAMAFVARTLAQHELIPESVAVEVDIPKSFELGGATAACSLLRMFRWMEQLDPTLFDKCWTAIFMVPTLAIPTARTANRDHTWEVANAAAYAFVGDDVDINLADGGVDLRGRFSEKRWGVECKMSYAKSERQRIDQIIEGVKQIEDDPLVDRGAVAVNVTNLIDHAPFMATLNGGQQFPRVEDARDALATATRAIALALNTKELHRRVARDKHGRPRTKCRTILFIAQAVALAGHEVRVLTSQFSLLTFGSERADKDFAHAYNAALLTLQMPVTPVP